MFCKTAFPAPPPLPGNKKSFPEVNGRALPSSVRKFLAKPATRPALALSVKPTATEARLTSPLAVKPQHHDHLQHASAFLRKQAEDNVFRSKIPVRIIANTTGRPEHQDNVIRTCDEAQHHPVAKKSLVDSVPKAFRARPSAPNSKIPSFVSVCGKGKQAVTTLQVQPHASHIQAAGFVSRIPVRILNGQAESSSFQRTMHSVILPPQSSTVSATVKTDFIPEITAIPEEDCREMLPQGDSLIGVQQEPCSGDELPGQEQSIVLDCMEKQRESVSDAPTAPLHAEPFVNEVTDAQLVQSHDAVESVVLADPQLESAAVSPLTRKQKRNAALNERRKRKKKAAKLLISEALSSSTLVDVILADEEEPVPSVPEPESTDFEATSTESLSVDAERIDLHMGNSQKTAKVLKQLEEGHPPFLPYVFVMDCIRPYVPQPTYEVKTQTDDERIHVSNIPLSVPSEDIVAYFEKLAGPVKYFSMYLNEDGFYNGKASVIFSSSSDARKAFLLYDGTLIAGRKLKLKLFVNGERLYPNQVTLPPPPGAFQLDWLNAPAPNRVIVPSLDCMREFMSLYPANFIAQ